MPTTVGYEQNLLSVYTTVRGKVMQTFSSTVRWYVWASSQASPYLVRSLENVAYTE